MAAQKPTQQLLNRLWDRLDIIGLSPDAEQIRDALWLASCLPNSSDTEKKPTAPSAPFAQKIPEQNPLPALPDRNKVGNQDKTPQKKPDQGEEPEKKKEAASPQGRPSPLPVYRSGDSTELYEAGPEVRPVRAPAPRWVDNELALGQALRALKRRVKRREKLCLDEQETVRATAEAGHLRPVFSPVRQARFDEVHLVIDGSPSMALWHGVARDLERLLRQLGAFRTVHSWTLTAEATENGDLAAGETMRQGRLVLRRGLLGTGIAQRPDRPFAHGNRHLVFVVSDGASSVWAEEAGARLTEAWSRHAPLALLHVLPPRLWSRAALGLPDALVQSSRPGAPGGRLRPAGTEQAKEWEELQKEENEQQLPPGRWIWLPVLALEPAWLSTWSAMVAGDHAHSPARAFWLRDHADAERSLQRPILRVKPDLTPEQRDSLLQRFFDHASPEAIKLAACLTVVSSNPAIARIIQHARKFKRESEDGLDQNGLDQNGGSEDGAAEDRGILAEVFQSGLIHRIKQKKAPLRPDDVLFEFAPEVEKALFQHLRKSEAEEIVGIVSVELAHRFGRSIDEFKALINDPSTIGTESLPLEIRQFCEIRARKPEWNHRQTEPVWKTEDIKDTGHAPDNQPTLYISMATGFDSPAPDTEEDHSERIQKDVSGRLETLVEMLEKRGVLVFRNNNPRGPFTDSQNFMKERLYQSQAMLVIYSRTYANSRVCQRELATGYIASQNIAQKDTGSMTETGGRLLILNPENDDSHIPPQEMKVQFLPNLPEDQAGLDQLADFIELRLRSLKSNLADGRPNLSQQVRSRPFPAIPASRFAGRSKEIWHIHTALTSGNTRPVRSKSVTLCGLAGAGKSMLALEYALRFADAWPGGIFWFDAGGEVDRTVKDLLQYRLMQNYRKIAMDLGLNIEGLEPQYVIGMVRSTLAKRGPYLWIVDNLPDLWIVDNLPDGIAAEAVKDWAAPSSNGVSLFTTRKENAAWPGTTIPLMALDEKAARDLLTNLRPPRSADERQAVEEIQTLLGNHALAVDVAGALTRDFSWEDLLAALKDPDQDIFDLAEQTGIVLFNGHDVSLAKTLMISFRQLPPPALTLLELASQMAPNTPIPQVFLAACLVRYQTNPVTEDPENSGAVHEQITTVSNKPRLEILVSVVRCAELSLIEAGPDSIQISPIVRWVMQRFIPADRAGDQRRSCAVEILNWFRTLADNIMGQTDHIDAMISHGDTLASNDPGRLNAFLSLSLGRFYLEKGDYQSSLHYCEAALFRLETISGDDHPDTLIAIANLAGTLKAMGRLQEARKLEGTVLSRRKILLGENNPDTLIAMANLARTMKAMGFLQEAKYMEENVLSKRQMILGENHPDTLIVMANLAETLKAMGRLQEAKYLEKTVLSQRQIITGENHPDTLIAMTNLAGTLKAMGRLQEAKELEENVISRRQIILGENNPDALIAMTNLAETLKAMGDLQKARKLEETILSQRKILLGENHHATITAMGNLALTLHALGELQTARTLQERVFEWYRQAGDEVDPDTRLARDNLAETLKSIENFHQSAPVQTTGKPPGPFPAVQISPDGSRLLALTAEGILWLIDAMDSDSAWSLRDKAHPITAFAFAPDGRKAVAVKAHGEVQLWDLDSRALLQKRQWWFSVDMPVSASFSNIRSLAVTPDGKTAILRGDDGSFWRSDLERGLNFNTLGWHSGAVRAIAMSPDGKHVLSAADDRKVLLLDSFRRSLFKEFDFHPDPVQALAFTPDGRCGVSGDSEGVLRIWDLESGEQTGHFSCRFSGIRTISLSADGRLVAVAGDSERVIVYNLESENEIASHRTNAPVRAILLAKTALIAADENADRYVFELPAPGALDRQPARPDKAVSVKISTSFSGPDGFGYRLQTLLSSLGLTPVVEEASASKDITAETMSFEQVRHSDAFILVLAPSDSMMLPQETTDLFHNFLPELELQEALRLEKPILVFEITQAGAMAVCEEIDQKAANASRDTSSDFAYQRFDAFRHLVHSLSLPVFPFENSEALDVQARTPLAALARQLGGSTAPDNSPLLAASEAGDLNMVRLLLGTGSDPDQADPASNTFPLLLASRNGHTDIAIALLESGASLDQARTREDSLAILRFLEAQAAERYRFGEFHAARTLGEAVLHFRQKLSGEEAQETQDARQSLARTLQALGELKDRQAALNRAPED